MKKVSVFKGCALVLCCFLALAAAFYFIAGDQLRFRDESSESVTPLLPLRGGEIRQSFTAQGDELLWLRLYTTIPEGSDGGFTLRVLDEAGTTVAQTLIRAAQLQSGEMNTVSFPESVPLRRGERYTLSLTAEGEAPELWYGNSVATARVAAPRQIEAAERAQVDGQSVEGMLVYSLRSRTQLRFGHLYWPVVWGLGALLTLWAAVILRRQNAGHVTLPFRIAEVLRRYGYLMRQLIARDFKTKYKRSVLGVFWSFLNPLLTMLVQYLVFSTLFRSDVANFRVYLLSGIVCFSFFSEAVGMSLLSIVGNAGLITKVYVPKYIYPLSRVLSSGINLALSLIPLFLVMLLTGTPLRPAALLLPFPLCCLLIFCVGMGFFLSTSMVFFRDTQFLWGVVSMLWMYLTPIFYPESIIPAKLMPLYKCNPLYHFIRFVRIVLIDGVSPEPKAYGFCLLAAFVPLAVGALVFRKYQDRFVLHL